MKPLVSNATAIAIIQARMSSSRLPGKVLMPLAGRPMIWHIHQRLKLCKHVNQIVVATSKEKEDDELANYCDLNNIQYKRGSLTNVLERFADIFGKTEQEYVARITGDCPLIYPEFIDHQIEMLALYSADFVQTIPNSTNLTGQGVYSKESLLRVYERSTDLDDQEHVGANYLSKNYRKFKVLGMKLPAYLHRTQHKLSIDEIEDYLMIEKIYDALWDGSPISINDVLDWLIQNPSASQINKLINNSAINIMVEKQKKEIKIGPSMIVDWFEK